MVVDDPRGEAPAPPSRKSGLLKRLPFFAFLALGLWLWKSGLLPQDREISWRLGAERTQVSGLEIQLWDDGGHLLKREEFFFQAAPEVVTQKVPLKEGHYTARIFLKHPGQEGSEQRVRSVDIGGSEAYGLWISDAR